MKLGVLIADTLPDQRMPALAIARTLRELPVHDCLVIGHECHVEGARHVRIAPLRGLADYNALLLDGIGDHLACDTYLVIQWDGFVLDGRRWRDAYLGYDYIGAPWLHRGAAVGAGGFSLRSRRLIEAVREHRLRAGSRDVATAEDLQICVTHRDALAAAGIRFAPTDVAATFAFERLVDWRGGDSSVPTTLGFHGAFNFPLVLPESEILASLEAIVARMPQAWPPWHLLVWHAWRRRYETLGIRLLGALAERDLRLWAQVGRACLARGVSPRWLKAAA